MLHELPLPWNQGRLTALHVGAEIPPPHGSGLTVKVVLRNQEPNPTSECPPRRLDR